MTIERIGARALLCCLVWSSACLAQSVNGLDNPDWAEGQVPPPPALSTAQLMPISMPPYITVQVDVDSASIQVGEDGVVRYVMVMRNRSGNTTAVYEGIRCASAEVKTYARLGTDGQWSMLPNAPWKNLTDKTPSPHALAFARQAACDGPVTYSRRDILDALKTPRRIIPTTH